MPAAIDTSVRRAIGPARGTSRAVAGVLALFAVIFVLGSFSVETGGQLTARLVGGGVAVVVLAVAAVVWQRSGKLPNEVIVFSPEGVVDYRRARKPLPWSAVTKVYERANDNGALVALDTSAEALAATEPREEVRYLQAMNLQLGPNALVLAPFGVKASARQLRHLAEAYWKAHRDR